jgi:hypothetical protein
MSKRFGSRVISFALLVFLSASAHGGAAGFLHAQKLEIVDGDGKAILLRGVGLGNWLLPEGYMWKFGPEGDRPRKIEKLVSDLIGPEASSRFWPEFRKNYITEADIARISELGFNSVRVPLNARLFLTEGDKPTFVEEGFGLLANLVKWSKAHGLYLIIDMHAAPGGQTGQNIDDSINDQPGLFLEPRNQDRLVQLWTRVATIYKDETAVGAYDLLNEPLPESTGAAKKFKAELEPLYKRITKAIREVDKNHMITLEGADWANEWSVFSQPFDENLLYQFHYYCWDKPARLKTIGEFLRFRGKMKVPIWVGETGEKDNLIYWGTTDYFEAMNVGWCFWPWKKMDTRNTPYSIKLPENWDQIVAYSNGKGKPSTEIAQKAFDQLLRNIQLENCQYFQDVINSLFHRVPARIEAENYGHEGSMKSYSVKGTEGFNNAKNYRTLEPVPVALIEAKGDRWLSEQAIRLTGGEWTAYNIASPEARAYKPVLKVKASSSPAFVEISANDVVQEQAEAEKNWSEITLKPIALVKGSNKIKLAVKQGTVDIDWIEFQ